MKTAMSPMSAHEFVEAVAALGWNYKQMAEALGRHPTTISGYVSGEYRIPLIIQRKLSELLTERLQLIGQTQNSVAASFEANVAMLRKYTRATGTKPRHRGGSKNRLLRRLRAPDTVQLPPIDLRRRQCEIALRSLNHWQGVMRERLRTTSPASVEHEEAARELADIRCIAGSWPRTLPYRVVLTRDEWQVMSRALRNFSSQDPYAFSFYQTWRRFYLRGGIDGRTWGQKSSSTNSHTV